MVGGKLVRAIHAKPGRNTGGFAGRKCTGENAIAIQQAKQLPYQRFLVRAPQLYTLAAPDSYEWLPTVWKQAMDLCCKSPLSMSRGYTSAPELRRTRLFSAGSIRPSSKTTWPNTSDGYAQSLAEVLPACGCAGTRLWFFPQLVMWYWWFIFAGRWCVQLFRSQFIGRVHISPTATEFTVR